MLGQPFLVLARLLSTQMGDIQRERNGARSLELGAKKFYEQRTTGPLLFESAPAPPSAGFNVTFEDWTLDTAAGAPLIFARLTAVTTKLL